MKKFLSLVLALVMTMSLVTISAGAKDFADADEVTYTEAVDVLSAVKVIDGYTDGAFKPNNQLNRGQAAKILCNMILGPTTASALKADAAPFKDVPADSTFAAYIAYCAKSGIIDGYTDGTFRPAAPLTGYAFMKLLLGALGYDKDVEGYNQPNWSINVAKRALSIGLDDGLLNEFDGTKIVTREEACLYALNTLKADMVEYDTKTNISVGGAEVVIAGSKADVSSANKYDGNVYDADGDLQFAEKYFTNLKVEADEDDFGRPSNVWKNKNDDIGTYSNAGDLVATYTKKVKKSDVYEVIGKSVYDDLKAGESTLTVYFDGQKTVVNKANIDTYATKNDSGKVNNTGNGDLTEIYVDDDSNVTIVTIRTYVFQAVGDYDSKKEIVTLGTPASENADTSAILADKTLELDDFAAIEDFKDEDYILVTAVKNSAGKHEVKSVAKAEVVTGTVSGYKLTDSVDMDGTTYSYSADTNAIKSTTYTVGQQAALVLDANGYIIAVDEAIVLSDYVFIDAIGSSSTLNAKALAKAIFPDGTSSEITLKKVLNDSSASSIVANKLTLQKKWYTFSKNSAGEYTLYPIESKYTQPAVIAYGANTSVSENNDVVFLNGQTYLANDKTVFVVSDKNDTLTVYTGVKNAPEIKTLAGGSANVYLLHSSTRYASLVYVDITGSATISGEKGANLVYVTKYDGEYRTTDNETYFTYKTLVDGETVVVKADNKINGLAGNVYGVANYVTKNSDDLLTGFQLVDTNGVANGLVVADTGKSATIAYSAGTLSIDGTGYVVTDNAAIDLVILKSANALNKDKDADFEVAANISAKELADTLKGYTCTYDYALKTTQTGNKVLEELYVTVTAATANNAGNNPNVPAVGNNVIGQTSVNVAALTVTGNVGIPSNAASEKALLSNALTAAGYNVVNIIGASSPYTLITSDGKTFTGSTTAYANITLNGTLVEQVEMTGGSDDMTTIDMDVYDVDGNGSGYIVSKDNGATWTYAAYSVDVSEADVTNNVIIKTGYVGVVNGTPAYAPVSTAYTVPSKADVSGNGTGFKYTVGTTDKFVAYGGTIPAADLADDITLTKDQVKVTIQGYAATATNKTMPHDYDSNFAVPSKGSSDHGTGALVSVNGVKSYVAYGANISQPHAGDIVITAGYIAVNGFDGHQTTGAAASGLDITWTLNGETVTADTWVAYDSSVAVVATIKGIGSGWTNPNTAAGTKSKLTAKVGANTDTDATFSTFTGLTASNGVAEFATGTNIARDEVITVTFKPLTAAEADFGDFAIGYTAGTNS